MIIEKSIIEIIFNDYKQIYKKKQFFFFQNYRHTRIERSFAIEQLYN